MISWIRHQANACSTGAVLVIQERMGLEGIGLYWLVFEAFIRSGGARRIDDRLTRSLAFELRVEQEPVREFLEVAVEVGILVERDGYLVFEEVAREIERSEQVAKTKRGAASTRWSGGDARAMHMHCTDDARAMHVDSTGARTCIVDKIDKKEEKERKKDPPALPPVELTEPEKKSLLEQMTPDELAYWVRAIALYRLRRPEASGDHAWVEIQRWRERALGDGQTWSPEKKTYLTKRAQDPPDDRAREKARILELKKKFQEEEKSVALKK